MKEPLTHKQAVQRMAAWLRNSRGCGVVMAELATQNHETPDAIGWFGMAGSILVEVKTSRADFFADGNKSFRRCEDQGMGDHRYFAAEPGILKREDIPEGWGLLEIREHQTREIVPAVFKGGNKHNEIKMLMSALRRLELSTAVFIQPLDSIPVSTAQISFGASSDS